MKQPSEKDKAKFQRGMHELNTGNPDKAIRLFEKVRKSWQDDPDILYLEGLAYGKLGDIDNVIRVSQCALDIQPGHFGALCNLANTQMLTGDKEAALENYKKALAIKPDALDVIDNYGRALGMLGHWDEAIALFKRALEIRRDYAPAHTSLGRAYNEGGDPDAAMNEFKVALKLDPKSYGAHMGIAELYTGAGGTGDAEYHYRQAIRLEKKAPQTYIGLASVYSFNGKYEEALKLLDKAESLGNTDHPAATASKADCYEHLGEYDKAYDILQQLAEDEKMTPMAVVAYTKVCRRFDVCNEALELVNLSTAEPSTNCVQKQSLMYAAGSLLDKLKRYDEAFSYFEKANNSVKYQLKHDYKRMYDILQNCFNNNTLPDLERSTNKSTRPIFIVGMPRSGTSLTEHILANHSDVYGAGELADIKKLTLNILSGTTHDTEYAPYVSGLNKEKLTELANIYLTNLLEINKKARFVTDKMPNNFQHIGLISLLFPESRIIHCRRNPLDTCLSIYFQNFVWSHDYATKLGNIGMYYSQYDRLMKHWEKVIDIPILTVQYEDMVADQESMTHKLLKFCNLEWDDSVMQFHNSNRTVATASYNQVRQPIYKTSQARWKNYSKFLWPLKEALPEHVLDDIEDLELIKPLKTG